MNTQNMKTLAFIVGLGGLFYWWTQSAPQRTTPISRQATPVTTGGQVFHTVQKGEWLSTIAPLYHLTLAQLLTLNPIFEPSGTRNPNVIEVGERIRVQ